MSRKILKIIISLLFLAVAAVAAVLGIKNFMPDLFDTISKYGVKKPAEITPARKTPAFKKDKQEQEKNNEEPGPVYRQIPDDMTDKYGVAPVNQLRLEEVTVESKYGVAPIQKNPRGVAPRDTDSMKAKYGVAPVEEDQNR